MGVDVGRLFTLVFGIGAALCAVAGALLGPLLAVQVGMGENILILAFVVDRHRRHRLDPRRADRRGAGRLHRHAGPHACCSTSLREVLPPQWASAAGPALASIAVYVFMAAVLALKPQGLFPVRA